VTVLETTRLRLRVPTLADTARLASALADADVMRYIGDGRTRSADDARRWIENDRRAWELDGFGKFIVTLRDERVIGRVGLSAWDPTTWVHGTRAELGAGAEIELGWTLLRDAWGHGYATEAAVAAGDWALGELGQHSLISLIHPDNVHSQAVARRLGEQHERDIITANAHPAQLWRFASGLVAAEATERLDRDRDSVRSCREAFSHGPSAVAPLSLKNPLFCSGFFQSGRSDSNRRPPVPQTGALTRLRHAPLGLDTSVAAFTSPPKRPKNRSHLPSIYHAAEVFPAAGRTSWPPP
jgi:RimJ/RimL family protein N-acetyltransferase